MKKGIIIAGSMFLMGGGFLLTKEGVSAEENKKEIQENEMLTHEENTQELDSYDVVSAEDNWNKYIYRDGKLERYSGENVQDKDLIISTNEFQEGDQVDIQVED